MELSKYYSFGYSSEEDLYDEINMTRALGHNNKAYPHFDNYVLDYDNDNSYKVIIGSDGFWDVICDSDLDMNTQSASELAKLAFERWAPNK